MKMKVPYAFIAVFIFCLIGSSYGARKCYRCLVSDGCLKLDIYGPNSTQTCGAGVEHCVTSRTESKVTGAIAVDHLCGGSIYTIAGASKLNGCFHSIDEPGERTKRTVCYCDSDLCNSSKGICPTSVLMLIISLISYIL